MTTKKQYIPTNLERDLIDSLWLMFPHAEIENYDGVDKTCRTVGAIAHELYSSLNNHGYQILINPILIENRELPPEHEKFFEQIHCAGDLLSQLPSRNPDSEDR